MKMPSSMKKMPIKDRPFWPGFGPKEQLSQFRPGGKVYQTGGARESRFIGTDENGQVYSVSFTRHSDREKFDAGYDNIEWDEE